MARFESHYKMGFYPTPNEVVPLIKSFCLFPSAPFSLLSPGCGTGEAEKAFLDGTLGQGYGVELDDERATMAKKNLFKVARGDFARCTISNAVFSVLYLNPPYDWSIESDGIKGDRQEKIFLRDSHRYLAPGGLLIYLIPQYVLDESIAKMLVYRFEDIEVFRFPGELYDVYKQVVIFAVKKEEPNLDEGYKSDVERLLLKASIGPALTELSMLESPKYEIPSFKWGSTVPLFRSGIIDLDDLEEAARHSSLFEKVRYLTSLDSKTITGRPPLDLRSGHVGNMLAAGQLDGEVVELPCGIKRSLRFARRFKKPLLPSPFSLTAHLVKGTVYRDEIVSYEYDDEEAGGGVTERRKSVVRVKINCLAADGEFYSLS